MTRLKARGGANARRRVQGGEADLGLHHCRICGGRRVPVLSNENGDDHEFIKNALVAANDPSIK